MSATAGESGMNQMLLSERTALSVEHRELSMDQASQLLHIPPFLHFSRVECRWSPSTVLGGKTRRGS